ncbi:MAG: hypothetical protein R8N24_01260 [Alphaproteobacteria bacterium]|nr:hypothetical protein [Alphaproteobacteria bacterium]
MKKLIKIFLILLPALYIGNATAEEDIATKIEQLCGTITPIDNWGPVGGDKFGHLFDSCHEDLLAQIDAESGMYWVDGADDRILEYCIDKQQTVDDNEDQLYIQAAYALQEEVNKKHEKVYCKIETCPQGKTVSKYNRIVEFTRIHNSGHYDIKMLQPTFCADADEAAELRTEDSEAISSLEDKVKSARETENSDVNKLLGSVGMGATGIGGMMLMQGLSEKAADDDATRAMQAYISTFNCTYGSNRVAGGTVAEIPGGNELIALYSEYVNLANNLKSVKNELGMRAGIESEPILDSATSGLYDDVSVGGTSGAYASLARALMNPNGTDAAAWAEQTEKTSKNITTGAITAGAGAGVSMIGDLTNKLVEKKKAEKSTKSK